MSSEKDLEARIAVLLRDVDVRFAAQQRARELSMERFTAKKGHFERVAGELIESVVRPRLQVLVRALAHSGSLEVLDGGHGLAVPFSHTDDFPAHARVDVSIAHDPAFNRAWCAFSATIIPILMEYERDKRLEVSLDSPDELRLGEFLDQRIENFVASYMSVREPDSMYQKGRLVTDPVCGMTFRRVDAQSVLEHEGRLVFFCADVCRKQFEAEPHRYAMGATLGR